MGTPLNASCRVVLRCRASHLRLLHATPPCPFLLQLRRMMMLLPEALGADQPASLEPVLTHFQAEAEGRASDWSLTALTRVRGRGAGSCCACLCECLPVLAF
jgi:hypothetical protein